MLPQKATQEYQSTYNFQDKVFLLLSSNVNQMDLLKEYLTAQGAICRVIITNIKTKGNMEDAYAEIEQIQTEHIIDAVIISSDIHEHQINEVLAGYLLRLRIILEENTFVVLLTPSRVHPIDRDTINRAVGTKLAVFQNTPVTTNLIKDVIPALSKILADEH